MPAEEATSVKRLRLCTEHKGERITHVCTTCNEMCCAHCFVDGRHAGHQWALLEGACSEVQKRVEKKTNSVNQMMQTTDRNLRTIAEWHDELNRSSDQVREKVESGVTRLLSLVDEREQSMHAGVQEMTKSKARVLAEMTDEVNQSKMQLQSGTDAALKAIEEQEKYDFIINSPELENWLSTLVDMDITVKVAAVGASLNTAVHWDNVHRTLDGKSTALTAKGLLDTCFSGLQLGLRPALADSVPSSPAHSAVSSQSRAPLPPIPTTAGKQMCCAVVICILHSCLICLLLSCCLICLLLSCCLICLLLACRWCWRQRYSSVFAVLWARSKRGVASICSPECCVCEWAPQQHH